MNTGRKRTSVPWINIEDSLKVDLGHVEKHRGIRARKLRSAPSIAIGRDGAA